GALFLLHEDLSLAGSLLALATVAAFLAAVVTCGVAVSAVANSTVLAISSLWMLLYGGGFVLSLLPARFPSPGRALDSLPYILRGHYAPAALGTLFAWSAVVSCTAAALGAVYFARRDV